jgi:hypothetical protein
MGPRRVEVRDMAAGNGSALVDVRTMRKALREARGKHKLDLLLSTDEPAKLVRSLPPEDLYLALLDIGPDDAAEVVALASPEQFRHFVDMSAWRGGDEGPRTSEVLRWLRLSREGGGDAGRMRFRYQLSGLDVELLALVLRRGMKVYDLGEDQDPHPENPALAFYTADRRFLLEFRSESEFTAMRQLIEALYERDEGAAGRLIEATRWEQSAELEEAARRWRDGRLRDLGVPDFEEAISFYARPASRAPAPPMAAPQTQALTAPQGNLMDAALELLSGEELELAEESAVYAANAALVANRVPLDDPDEVREQLADARATLSLGLELLSGGDPVRASRVLVELPIRQLFQTAMGEAYRLQTRARKVAQAARLPQAQSATLLDEPLESAVQALLKPRPLFHEPGKRRPRAFATRADVAAVEAMLDEAEAVVALLSALGIPPAVLGPKADEAEVGAAALKASSALRALIESRIAGVPLSLRSVGDENHPLPSGFEQRLDEALQNATGGFPTDTLARAAQRLRSSLTR